MLFLLVLSPAKIGPTLPPVVLRQGHAADQPGAVGTGRRLEVDDLGAQHRQQVAVQAGRPRRRSCRGPAGPRTAAPLARRSGRGRVGLRPRDRARRAESCSPSRGAGSGGRRRPDPSRKGGRGFAGAVPWVRDERPPRPEVVDVRDVRTVGDRRVGDPERRRQLEDLLGRCARRSIRRSSGPAPCGRGTAIGPPSTRGAPPSRRSRATAGRSRHPRPTRPSLAAPTPGVGDEAACVASVVPAGRCRSPGSR